MKSRRIIFIIGLILFFMPVLGLPSLWKNTILVLFGVILCGMTISDFSKNYRNKLANDGKDTTNSMFIQNELNNSEKEK